MLHANMQIIFTRNAIKKVPVVSNVMMNSETKT